MSRINGFVGRRNFLLGAASFATAGGLLWYQRTTSILQAEGAQTNPVNPHPVTATEALKRLLEGNQRFVDQKRKYPDQSLKHVQSLAKGQYPFAAVLGCADSRVPTEIIFDQGLGNLFVVRVAGNVASDMAIGSLEYATSVLGSQLIVVLGHKKCGAVMAALQEKPAPGRINYIVREIRPAIARARLTEGDVGENAIAANIKYQAEKLQSQSTILANLIQKGKLQVVGACYDINTGRVSIC
ncbi:MULTISPECIES: carbonic anhydrase [Nostocales]|uniref:carbonic anhydrase n=3 Tax=Nostocales TaxID=1161 RepID=A0A0C1QRI0_9CYAN|nr:carbonic anhydrase [Tolypothrix bouteillei]KAF3891229.1 carbonic anhydrase [Tolypothrix bouteillei VB521301]